MKYDERPDTYASKGWHSYMRLRESEKRVKEFHRCVVQPIYGNVLCESSIRDDRARFADRADIR